MEKVTARKWARAAVARQLAEATQAARANEADLVEFGKHQAKLERAAQRRDTMIAAAATRYEHAAADARAAQGAALARLRERGMADQQICEITGVDRKQLRALLEAETPTPDRRGRSGAGALSADDDETAAGSGPAQAGQAEEPQRDHRGPRPVFERPRPMPGQPHHDTET